MLSEERGVKLEADHVPIIENYVTSFLLVDVVK